MISRVNKILSKNGHSQSGRTVLGWLLVMMVAFALIFIVSLIWLDNSVAIIPNNDSTTSARLEIVDGKEVIAVEGPEFQATDHDQEDLAKSQKIVRGNGGRDDNRERPFVLSLVESDIVPIIPIPVVAYWKLGHLKVMQPAEMLFTVLNLNRDIYKASRVAL